MNGNSRAKGTLQSSVQSTAEALRIEILEREDGELIGSEDDLLEQFGVSRPTFRQAAKIVEHEQLLTIRRGVGGGFFAKKPSTKAVSRMTAVYLKSNDATQEHLQQASTAILAEAAALAAESIDTALHEELLAFLIEESTYQDDLSIQSFMASEKRFFDLVFSLASNPVLRLFSEVIMDYSLTFVAKGVFSKRVDRAQEYATLRNRLGKAISERDSEIAYTLARRCGSLVREWMERDKLSHHDVAGEVARK